MVCSSVFNSSRSKAKGMESRLSLSTWLMLQRHWTGLQHVSNPMHSIICCLLYSTLQLVSIQDLKKSGANKVITCDVISHLLCRPDQVFWLWTWRSDPVWYQKWPLHRQRIPWGEQVAGHAWWVHQKICAVSWVWQPWNWPGKDFSVCNVGSGTFLSCQYGNWQAFIKVTVAQSEEVFICWWPKLNDIGFSFLGLIGFGFFFMSN